MATTTALVFAMTNSQTSMQVADTSAFPVNGGVVQVDSEIMIFSTATDRSLIGLTRAAQGTSAATHAIGATVTLLESSPFLPGVGVGNLTALQNLSVLALTDPTAVPTQTQIDNNDIIAVTLDGSGANQTWTLPKVNPPAGRVLIMGLTSPASFSLTVNTLAIAAGTTRLFTWTGSAWLGQ